MCQNMRVKENNAYDRAFIDFLLRVGDGTEPAVHSGDEADYIRIPDDILFTPRGQPIDDSHERDSIWKVYPDISTTDVDPTIFRDSAILTPLNADVDKQ
ncbi:hypothetical protein BGZ58_009892 [Dissophora ornata]|nr:hypothetical protein BGZ58_009892 [Dissophora ornata]